MRRRLNLLKDDPQAMRFLASVLLLGTKVGDYTATKRYYFILLSY